MNKFGLEHNKGNEIPSGSLGQPRLRINRAFRKRNYKFIERLVEMLDECKFNEVICWSEDGLTIEIKNLDTFVNVVLPWYFKHNSMSNFVRQMNMYDFRKMRNYKDSTVMGYRHPMFKQSQKSLTSKILRKTSFLYPCNNRLLENNKNKVSHMPIEGCNQIDSNSIHSRNMINKLRYLRQRIQLLEGKVDNLENKSNSLLDNPKNSIFSCIGITEGFINRMENIVYNLTQEVFPKVSFKEDIFLNESANPHHEIEFSTTEADLISFSCGASSEDQHAFCNIEDRPSSPSVRLYCGQDFNESMERTKRASYLMLLNKKRQRDDYIIESNSFKKAENQSELQSNSSLNWQSTNEVDPFETTLRCDGDLTSSVGNEVFVHESQLINIEPGFVGAVKEEKLIESFVKPKIDYGIYDFNGSVNIYN